MGLKTAAFIGLSLLAAQVNAFTVDKSAIDTAATLTIPTLNSLEINQNGWIEPQKLNICIAAGQLRIERHLPLVIDNKKRKSLLEVSRVENGINIDFSLDSSKENQQLYQQTAYQIATAPNCISPGDVALPIVKVFGAQSQSELLSMADKYMPLIPTKDKLQKGAEAKPVSNWFTAVENDDSGAPLSVTFSQADSQQHTLLEVTCSGLNIAVSMAVNDFLGNSSQNALLRFDQEKFKPIRLGLTENSRGFVFGQTDTLLPNLRQKQEMALRYTNYNGATKTLVYPLAELDEKLTAYPALCGTE
jgi:hypothetical protein